MTVGIPKVIEPLLQDYWQTVQAELPDFVTALYLQGSVALGAFQAEHSDIDFVAFTSRVWNAQDLTRLKAIHAEIAAKYPSWPFEGTYLEPKSLLTDQRATAPYLTYHNKQLTENLSLEINHVDWWLLKQHGITVFGAVPFDFEVEVPLILANMRENLNTYWAAYTRKPARIAQLFTDWGISGAVLGVLRQYYSFREKDITSKVGAGEYAMTKLPFRWHRLIQEAVNIRQSSGKSLYRFKTGRALDAYRFLRYIIKQGNSLV